MLCDQGATWRKDPSVEKRPSSDWPVDMAVGPFLLLIVIVGPSSPQGSGIPGQMDLGCTRDIAEQTENKPICRVPPWCLLLCLPWFPSVDC